MCIQNDMAGQDPGACVCPSLRPWMLRMNGGVKQLINHNQDESSLPDSNIKGSGGRGGSMETSATQ